MSERSPVCKKYVRGAASSARHDFGDLIEVMKRLRDPAGGCPWDLEQNFETIAPYTIEEAYEVADAVRRNDMENLCEELGDLLLQSVYHAQMASEQGHFNIADVVDGVTRKMIERHPHVFGDENAQSPQEVDAIWDSAKEREKQDKGQSALSDVPLALPALLRASKLQKRAQKAGFFWRDISQALDKAQEEWLELQESIVEGNKSHIEEELGDVLFVLANIGRMLDINPEEALRKANSKFEDRFENLEQHLRDQGRIMQDASEGQLLQAWMEIKGKNKL